MVDKYAQFLKSMGMMGIMLNGMTGEGMTLTMDERKKLTEKWMEATRKYNMKMIVNIGGADLPEMYEMAEHAEKLKVDAVMLMPDFFYRPRTEEDLVMYLKDIMTRMPTRPMFYYHIPVMTEVYSKFHFYTLFMPNTSTHWSNQIFIWTVDMYRFMHLMEKEVHMFAGLFWADDNIDKVSFLKEKMPEFNYIIGMGTSMMGFFAEGFESFSMTAMNLYPEMIKEIYDYMLDFKMNEAFIVKKKMIKRVYDLFRMDINMDFMTVMKIEMDKIYPAMKMGPTRKPQITTNKAMMWMGKM